MSTPPLPSENAEVADLVLLAGILGCWNEQFYHLSKQLDRKRPSPSPAVESSTNLPFFRELLFTQPTSSPVYGISQAEPALKPGQNHLSSVLPPLCSGISLIIKSFCKFQWGFLSISVSGHPRTSMQTPL